MTVITIFKLILNRFKGLVHDFFERGDMFMLVLCLICSFFSVVAVYLAANGMVAGGVTNVDPTRCLIIQIASVMLGVVAYFVFTVLDADILGENWKVLAFLNMGLLVALMLFGSADDTGNKAWIHLGPINLQPSEVIKIFYIIISAKQMTYLKEHTDINSFWSVAQLVAHVGIVFVAIMAISSDLGSATILLAVFALMFFALGVKLYWFGLGGAALAAVIPLIWNFVLKDYQKKRLVAPYDPSVDPTGYGIRWQTEQSKLTLASGRATGVDASHRYSVFTGKHTDFIFAAIGENFGMIGCVIVMALLLILIIHCIRVGLHCNRVFDTLICIGVAGALTFQTFINIGMCIGITPVIGITLPFFSYGGSSMVTLFSAVGIVSGIRYKPKPQLFSVSL